MPTSYDGSENEKRALNAYIKFMRASESLGSYLSSALSDYNLTMSQFGTLEVIYHLGPLCQKAIGEKLLKSGGNITMVVNNLEERGLVRRKRRESDRRFVSVELTDEGSELIQEVLPDHVGTIREIFEELSDEEQRLLGRLSKKIGLRVVEEADS